MTRAEAIRRLESMATDLTGACAEAQSDKVSAYIARKIEAVDMAIAALKEQDVTDINVGYKWISVAEKLPEDKKDEYVLVVCDYHGKISVETRKKWNIDSSVTHWMPLPQPPKEDNHDVKT